MQITAVAVKWILDLVPFLLVIAPLKGRKKERNKKKKKKKNADRSANLSLKTE